MTDKDVLFDEDVTNKLLEGISYIHENLRSPLHLEKLDIISSKDPAICAGIYLAKKLLQNMQNISDKNATTALLLFYALCKEGTKHIAAGADALLLKHGMEKALHQSLKELDMMSKKVSSKEILTNIAEIAASNQKELGSMICEALQKVSHVDNILITESSSLHIETLQGMHYASGYLSPYFCTDKEQMTAVMSHPKILITDKEISSVYDLQELLQIFVKTEENILLIAEAISDDVIASLALNKIKNILNIAAIALPKDQKDAFLEDMAIATKAKIISDTLSFSDVTYNMLGDAEKIYITKDSITLIEKKSRTKALLKHLQKSQTTKRLSYLAKKVAIIHVPFWEKRQKQLLENSYKAIRFALEEGIVIGDDNSYIHAAKRAKSKLHLEKEEKLGADIFFSSLTYPLQKFLIEAKKDPYPLITQIEEATDTIGFNKTTADIQDLHEMKIVAATKIVKTTLLQATRQAISVLLTRVLICEKHKQENAHE